MFRTVIARPEENFWQWLPFCNIFPLYLLGVPFTIRTDHGALTWIQKFQESEQIAWWVWQLQEFDFTIIHHPSDQHNNTDTMSCIPCKQSGIDPSDGVITLAAVTIPNLKSLCEYSSEEVHACKCGTNLLLLMDFSTEYSKIRNRMASVCCPPGALQ